MPEELLIDVNEFETRVALLKDNTLQEVHIERSGTYSLTGNIYNGKVDRILPGMQAAFVDVGLSRPGFLHVRDIEAPRVAPGEETEPPDIRDLLHQGQTLLVQVSKDPIAGKGARLTTNLAIAARFMVLLPCSGHIGISQRIEDEGERERLRNETEALREELAIHAGFIVRTAAEGATREQIATDMRVLERIWSRVDAKGRVADDRQLVYEELPVHIRVIRDLTSADLTAALVNDRETHRRISDYVGKYLPEFADRVRLYDGHTALFERFGVDDELQRSLCKKVELKSGGYLVIEQTEAMTTIDVNTGAFLGGRNLEETAFRTNFEAATLIPRELRLRNIGGIIVVDFIDMEDEAHQGQVMGAFEKGAEGDPGRIRLMPFSALGLVELSRKRTRESMSQLMCEPCAQCGGDGIVKTAETTCYEIFRSLANDARLRNGADTPGEYMVRAHESVVERLLDEDAKHLDCLVTEIGRAVRFQVEPSCAPGEFDVVLVQGVQR